MLTIFAFVLSLVASTFAYKITFPNEHNGWTDTGPQLVQWTMVDTDPANFTLVLDNQSIPGFVDETLIALVNGSMTSIMVNPPSAGWVDGSDYRVNFVRNTQSDDGILAQSDQFNISSSTSTTSTSGTTGATVVVVPTASVTSGTTAISSSSASGSASILPTSPSSAAALSYPVQTGLLGLFSLLGFALA